jgi:hypothetical protein
MSEMFVSLVNEAPGNHVTKMYESVLKNFVCLIPGLALLMMIGKRGKIVQPPLKGVSCKARIWLSSKWFSLRHLFKVFRVSSPIFLWRGWD